MKTRFFRKKFPDCNPGEIEWIEMTSKEFHRFVQSPEGKDRHFVDMGDIVLEAPEADAREYRAEQNHRFYIQSQKKEWSIVSLYASEKERGLNGEEMIWDETQDVEAEVLLHMEITELQKALKELDSESYQLIHSLYLTNARKTLRQLSQSSGIPVMTLQDRKKKILARLAQELLKKKI